MLQLLVGNVDLNGAIVLAVLFITMGVSLTTWFAQRSRQEIDNDFELAKMKQADATRIQAMMHANAHEQNLRKIDTGLITSHARVGDEE